MSQCSNIDLERFRYWQGQRLRSRDLRDQVDDANEMRWWHNRGLHQAFGVRFGLEVTPVIVGGQVIAVSITCGLAFDCYGRELALVKATQATVPAIEAEGPTSFVLVVRSGACGIEFVWVDFRDCDHRRGVRLARIEVDYRNTWVLDSAFRADTVRPQARPRVASGNTPPGGTTWELWKEVTSQFGRITELPVGYQVTVDTTAGGFTDTPCYFAWIAGELWSRTNIEFIPFPLTHIDLETYRSFRFRVWMPSILALLGSRLRVANLGFESQFVNFARVKALHLCWVGVQHKPESTMDCDEPADIDCVTP